jgi:hypothetical protein
MRGGPVGAATVPVKRPMFRLPRSPRARQPARDLPSGGGQYHHCSEIQGRDARGTLGAGRQYPPLDLQACNRSPDPKL